MIWTWRAMILINSNSSMSGARSDLRLVLTNASVLFGLVTMRLSHASDSATESVLTVM
jgi:hypothetical protein